MLQGNEDQVTTANPIPNFRVLRQGAQTKGGSGGHGGAQGNEVGNDLMNLNKEIG